jgi:TPR repeat protein
VTPALRAQETPPPTDEALCQAGDTGACVSLGIRYDTDAAKAKELATQNELTEKSASAFQRACDGGNALGCMSIAVAYDRGSGVTRDPKRAKVLLTKAKAARVVEQRKEKAALVRAQRAQAQAQGPGKVRTGKRAQATAAPSAAPAAGSKETVPSPGPIAPYAPDRGRSRGPTGSTAMAGTAGTALATMGTMGAPTEAAPVDPTERTPMQNERACDRGDAAACYFLSACFANGEGVKKNPLRADELIRRADRLLEDGCKVGDPKSCLELAGRVEETNLDRAHKLLVRACSLDKSYCR